MRTLLALITIILLSSCGSQKPLVIGKDKIVKDSVIVTRSYETVYDTIKIAADSASVKKDLDELTERPVTVKSKSGRSSVTLSRKGNEIIATSYCEELEEKIAKQKELIEIQRERIEQLTTTQQVEVKYVPWYWKAGMFLLIALNILQFFKSKIPFL